MFRFRTYILLIIFVGLLLFAKGLTNGFVGDDYLQIVDNTKIHSLANLPAIFTGSTYENGGSESLGGIFYRPMMMTIFAIIYSFAGPNPFFFHFVQLLFHIANVILLFIFLRRFLKDIGAFAVAILFLIHPINTEAVLYSANLQEVLFFFFGMLALLSIEIKKLDKKNIFFISFLLLLSLLSKESGILFLIIVLFYSWIFGENKKQLKFLSLSLSVTFFIYLFLRYIVAHMYAANKSLAPIVNLPIWQRLLNIPAIITTYLQHFFYPKDLNVYQFWVITSPSVTNFWLPLLVVLCSFSLVIIGYLWIVNKHRSDKKIYLFFLGWFGVGLTLHLQILPLDATIADRWFYFPIVGLLMVIGILIKNSPFWKVKREKIVLSFFIIIVIGLLAVRTFIRIDDWKNDVTLYGHDIHSPSNFILENAYGSALITDSQFEKAKYHVELSVREHPYSANLNNLAIIATSEGNYPAAKQYFQQAVQKGQNFSVYENYANFLLYYDDINAAQQFARQALRIYPKSAKLWLIYAEAIYIQGDHATALKATQQSYAIQPSQNTEEVIKTMEQNRRLLLR